MNERTLGWTGVVTFGLFCVVCVRWTAPRIQTDIESRTGMALAAAGISIQGLSADGRDVGWHGVVDEISAPRIRELLLTVPGVRTASVHATASVAGTTNESAGGPPQNRRALLPVEEQ